MIPSSPMVLFGFVGPKTQEAGWPACQCSVNDKYQILKHPFGHPAVASDVTKTLDWIKRVMGEESRNALSPGLTTLATEKIVTSVTGQHDSVTGGNASEENCSWKISGGEKVSHDESDNGCPVFVVSVFLLAILIIVNIIL